ncbi:MAG: hypothetical protein WAT79_06915 [Saprospiraceae bacterium]
MTLISKLFTLKKSKTQPHIQFGRYCDAYKSDEQLGFWDSAVNQYSKEKYIDSFQFLLQFLKEPTLNNVEWTQANGKLQFKLYQGSKLIEGEVTAIHSFVVAKIARFSQKEVGWMRILLEENYNMTYSRFAINDNQEIIIVFDNYMEEALPHKMYEALRELSVRADKIDDILLSEFGQLEPIQNDHIFQLNAKIVEAKYLFFKKKTNQVLQNINLPTANMNAFTGSFMYMILACAYCIDYLVKPEGALMKNIEHCHRGYFNDQAEDVDAKTSTLIQNFREVASISESEIKKELYESRSTFGLDLPTGLQGLREIIEAQWSDLDWFLDNNYLDVHRFVCDYVVGFSLFSFALPSPYKDILRLYYQVTENDYFISLGYEKHFLKNGILLKKDIIKEIQNIKVFKNSPGQEINFDTKVLIFDDLPQFCHSFLLMVKLSILREL